MKAWFRDFFANLKADIKRAHTSLTIWFNVALVPALAVYWPQIWDALLQLQPVLPENKWQVFIAANAIINAMLRFRTSKALRDK